MHNKLLKFVPAFRASTGRAKARRLAKSLGFSEISPSDMDW